MLPPLCLSLTATPLFLLVAVAIGLEYNAAHSSVVGCWRLSSVVVSWRQNVSESSCRFGVEKSANSSRVEYSSSVCYSRYVESDNDAVDRRRGHFVIVRLEVVQG